ECPLLQQIIGQVAGAVRRVVEGIELLIPLAVVIGDAVGEGGIGRELLIFQILADPLQAGEVFGSVGVLVNHQRFLVGRGLLGLPVVLRHGTVGLGGDRVGVPFPHFQNGVCLHL